MTEKECARCGKCCMVLPLSVSGMTHDYRKYLLMRGLKEDQGFILVPHECQHLKTKGFEFGRSLNECLEHYCAIHDSPERSLVCRKFTGQKRIGPWRVYVPPECAFNKKE